MIPTPTMSKDGDKRITIRIQHRLGIKDMGNAVAHQLAGDDGFTKTFDEAGEVDLDAGARAERLARLTRHEVYAITRDIVSTYGYDMGVGSSDAADEMTEQAMEEIHERVRELFPEFEAGR